MHLGNSAVEVDPRDAKSLPLGAAPHAIRIVRPRSATTTSTTAAAAAVTTRGTALVAPVPPPRPATARAPATTAYSTHASVHGAASAVDGEAQHQRRSSQDAPLSTPRLMAFQRLLADAYSDVAAAESSRSRLLHSFREASHGEPSLTVKNAALPTPTQSENLARRIVALEQQASSRATDAEIDAALKAFYEGYRGASAAAAPPQSTQSATPANAATAAAVAAQPQRPINAARVSVAPHRRPSPPRAAQSVSEIVAGQRHRFRCDDVSKGAFALRDKLSWCGRPAAAPQHSAATASAATAATAGGVLVDAVGRVASVPTEGHPLSRGGGARPVTTPRPSTAARRLHTNAETEIDALLSPRTVPTPRPPTGFPREQRPHPPPREKPATPADELVIRCRGPMSEPPPLDVASTPAAFREQVLRRRINVATAVLHRSKVKHREQARQRQVAQRRVELEAQWVAEHADADADVQRRLEAASAARRLRRGGTVSPQPK